MPLNQEAELCEYRRHQEGSQPLANFPNGGWLFWKACCFVGVAGCSWLTLSICASHRKAVKATLVLLPLLGITYMLFFINPGEDDISQIVFIYFNSFLQSFQVRIWAVMQLSIGQSSKRRKKKQTAHAGSESLFLVMQAGRSDAAPPAGFSLWEASSGKMIGSSILLAEHTIRPSLAALCSQLTWLARSCCHGCPSLLFLVFLIPALAPVNRSREKKQ